jgi:DNA-binding transcriptional LysR family regulator
VFLERSRLLLSRAEEAIGAAQRVSEGSSGSLKLGFVGSATYDAIPSILRCFHQNAPRVELTLSEMTVHVQLEALAEKRIDLGFLRLPARTEGLVFRTVSREALLIALPSSHALAQIPVLRLSSLAGEPFILYPDHPRPSWAEFIVGLCQQAGFRPTIAQRTVEIQTTLSLVAAGMGVSIVPACVSNIPRKDVVYRRLSGVRARTQLLAAYRAEDTSPVLRSFLRLMWQMLRIGRARAKQRISERMGHAGCEHGRSPSAA